MKNKHSKCEMCGRDSTAVESMRIAVTSLQRTRARVSWRKAHEEWRAAAWRSYQGRRQNAVEAELVEHGRTVREAARGS